MLTRTYAPHPELAPYIRRHYVFEAEMPENFVLEDHLLSETGFVRVLIKGDWAAKDEAGNWQDGDRALLFGANSRQIRVRVRGSFHVAAFAIRPSGWCSLFEKRACEYTDKIVPLKQVWGSLAEAMVSGLDAAKDDGERVAAMEKAIRAELAHIGKPETDEQMAELEKIARKDSTTRVESLSARFGLSVRQIERRCLATFGLSPKGVLRRSRFLDMATALRGFSTPSEEQLAGLRYFDQSHLNREFRHYVGMPPGAFSRATTPLFTLGLQMRDEGKRLIPDE